GPSITTRSPVWRMVSNRSRKVPTCPPGLERIRTSASAGGAKDSPPRASTIENAAKVFCIPEIPSQFQTNMELIDGGDNDLGLRPFRRNTLSVAAFPAQ